jgi:membrane protease YdiL (CAAX protease family)
MEDERMETSQSNHKSNPTGLILFTWAIVLLISDLPNAIWQALIGAPPVWLFWAKIGLLFVLILASLAYKPIQVVRPYFFLLLVLMLALWGMNWLRGMAAYIQWEKQIGWVWAMTAYQLQKLVIAFIMIAVLLLIGKRWKDFFLTRGQLNTPIRPVRPGQNPGKRSLSWGGLGLILGLCIAPLTLLFMGLGNFPSSAILLRALPFFPAALLFAATNAFSEEMQFRASFLGDLQKILGEDHAIWITAVFFGFVHYFGGTPAGIPGVLIAGLLGALFAKCMLESKGIVVPWFIHFCQNAVIYAFWAIGSVA